MLNNLKSDDVKSHASLAEGIVFLARFKMKDDNERQDEIFT